MAVSLLWHRQDLRLRDNPALMGAIADGSVIPVYVLDDSGPGTHPIGSAQRWWLHHSLQHLDESYRAIGNRLIHQRQPLDATLLGAGLVDENNAGVEISLFAGQPLIDLVGDDVRDAPPALRRTCRGAAGR